MTDGRGVNDKTEQVGILEYSFLRFHEKVNKIWNLCTRWKRVQDIEIIGPISWR